MALSPVEHGFAFAGIPVISKRKARIVRLVSVSSQLRTVSVTD